MAKSERKDVPFNVRLLDNSLGHPLPEGSHQEALPLHLKRSKFDFRGLNNSIPNSADRGLTGPDINLLARPPARPDSMPSFPFKPKFILQRALALDLDGSPRAYHINDEGIEANSSGGIRKAEAMNNRFKNVNGNAYGLATVPIGNTGYKRGFINAGGYFVSGTALQDKTKPVSAQERYVNSETIPYIASSPAWKRRGIQYGDIALVHDLKTDKKSFAIFADYRTNDASTEISLALAQKLDIPVGAGKRLTYDRSKRLPYWGGIADHPLKIYYFPKSGDGTPKTVEEIDAIGLRLFSGDFSLPAPAEQAKIRL